LENPAHSQRRNEKQKEAIDVLRRKTDNIKKQNPLLLYKSGIDDIEKKL